MTRRDFLLGAAAASVAAPAAAAPAALDPNRIILASDVHIPLPWSEQRHRTGREYPWIVGTVRQYLAEILALKPLPANMLVLGDLSIAFGEEKEYAVLRELLQPLYDRGVKVTLGMGNHDSRAGFAKSFPSEAAQTLVPGRCVYKVETPNVDFILLDTLKEPDSDEHYRDRGGYELGAAQTAWARKTLVELKKPTFVCGHHGLGATGLGKEIVDNPKVVGYLHGHSHQWSSERHITNWSDRARTLRSVGIGSFGIECDVGYGIMDVTPRAATLSVVAKDYYFPTPRTDRPPLWDTLRDEHVGRKIVFPIEA